MLTNGSSDTPEIKQTAKDTVLSKLSWELRLDRRVSLTLSREFVFVGTESAASRIKGTLQQLGQSKFSVLIGSECLFSVSGSVTVQRFNIMVMPRRTPRGTDAADFFGEALTCMDNIVKLLSEESDMEWAEVALNIVQLGHTAIDG